MIQRMLPVWFSLPLPFQNPACMSESFQFMYHWNLAWGILSIILLACETREIVGTWNILWHCPSLGLKQSYGYCWVFQICWHIECSTFTASSFRIWNHSTGIPSPPLALFVVILPKAHLTSHSRMSGSRLVITPSWLSALWRSFVYSSSEYSCYLFLISSASIRSIPFLSFIGSIFHEIFPWYL